MEKSPSNAASSPEGRQSPVVSGLYFGLGLALAFIAGLAIGFWGRPQLIKDLPIEVMVTVVTEPAAQAQAAEPTRPATPEAAPATSEPAAASEDTVQAGPPTPDVMEIVMADARHIQGSDDAPVTIVEFSDFK